VIKAALRNPIAVFMCSVGVIFFGLIALDRLPVDLFPKLSVPVVFVGTSFPGAAPETVEQAITFPMEQALAQAWNIDRVTSRTRQGLSIVYAWFRWGSDIDAALLDVQQQVQAIGDSLPEHARRPMIVKFDLSSIATCFLSITSDELDERELYDLGRYVISPQLAAVPGVAAATVSGGRRRQINVDLDPDRLRQVGLSLLDVERTIRRSNVVVPSGSLVSGRMDYNVFSNTQMTSVKELEEVVVRMVSSEPGDGRHDTTQKAIRVQDLGRVSDSHAEQNQIVHVNGKRGIYMPVYKQPGSNTILTVQALRDRLGDLHGIPPSVKLDVAFDQSNYIKDAIASLKDAALLGTSLTLLVVLLFLAAFSGTLVVGLSLPLSVLLTLAVLYLTGETLNVFTLGGLALAIGRLVDNAIVVLENINRHHESGKTPLLAALDGTREVAAPVLAGTLTTVVVFCPVFFLTGISKYLFAPMGLAIGVAMFASYVVSLTVIPALARRLLGRGERAAASPVHRLSRDVFAAMNRFLGRLDRGYLRTLEGAMKRRRMLLAGVALAFCGSVGLAFGIGADFFPPVDEGEFTIAARAPIGTRVDETETLARRIEAIVREEVPPEELLSTNSSMGAARQGLRAMLASNSGPHAAKVRVELAAPEHRKHGVEHYIKKIRERTLAEFPGLSIIFDPRGTVRTIVNFGYKAPIVVEVRGYDLDTGSRTAAEVERSLKKVAGLADVKSIRQDDYPNLQIDVDRQRAARFGITQDDVARVLLGSVFGNLSRPPFISDPQTGYFYEVITRLDAAYRDDIDSLGEITLQYQDKPVLLRSIATIRRGVGPVEIERRDAQRVAEVTANLLPGANIGDVAKAIRERLKEIEVPSGFSVELKGQSEQQAETNRSLAIATLIALFIVYMIMAAQFRALLQPLIILLTVPLGMIGVLVALFVTGTSFSSSSLMGILMMVGIVVSNGILLVEYANQQRRKGASPTDAAVSAGRTRLRPILMTSLTGIFGLIPMAIGGPGAELYAPLARVVMGGMVASTGLSLFVVPILYVIAEERFPLNAAAQLADDAVIDAS
jgi:CzcA family heavy metal efflux pump